VSLHTIARFNKMKRLCKGDPSVAAAALRAGSTALEVDAAGGSVRRLAPLPDSDPMEIGARTVVAENLPANPTAASLEPLFARAGRVRMLRLCEPTAGGGAPKSTLQAAAAEDAWGALNVVSTQQHALVEYESRAEALAAVAALNDNTNWRTGLRVRLVRREAPSPFAKQQQQQRGEPREPRGGAEEAAAGAEGDAAAAAAAGGGASGEAGAGEGGGGGGADGGADGAPAFAPAGKGRGRKERAPKRDYAAWASVGAHRDTQEKARAAAAAAAGGMADAAFGPVDGAPAAAAHAPDATAAAAAVASDGAVRPVRRFAPPSGGVHGGAGGAGAGAGNGPAVREAAMPDGTRGFTRGRGRPLNPPLPLAT
jgi:hypothetical protein